MNLLDYTPHIETLLAHFSNHLTTAAPEGSGDWSIAKDAAGPFLYNDDTEGGYNLYAEVRITDTGVQIKKFPFPGNPEVETKEFVAPLNVEEIQNFLFPE